MGEPKGRAPHAVLSALAAGEAASVLARCCAAPRWVEDMLHRRPFPSLTALHQASDEAFAALTRDDYLNAFAHHPAIGASAAEVATSAGASASHARREQAGMLDADAATREQLHQANAAYRARFGFVFLVCAAGKSSQQMLELLRARLGNEPDVELQIAAAELAEITRLRLDQVTA